MAGSPGAGKTEFSKSFIQEFEEKHPPRKIVRIDADDIREFIPAYTKHNSSEVQGAASLGVEKLLDCVLANGQDFLLDATFADYEKSRLNVKRCLKRDRKVGVIYLYQDPLIAWNFTKKREIMEGRPIPNHVFINAFFAAKLNVQKIKDEFKKDIELWLINKNLENDVEKTFFNIDNIDSYLKIKYNTETLFKIIK